MPAGGRWLRDLEVIDVALYAAVATTDTPALDAAMRRLSAAADMSRLWIAGAAVLSLLRGRSGRRAAALGVASIGVTSTVVNVAIKPVFRRTRPDRDLHGVPHPRHVPMPTSRSFPSGHSASAFAFAGGVGRVLPGDAIPLHLLAGAVAYSRVHTGVHFPGDVVLGSVLGTVGAQLTTHQLERRRAS